jgi:hypothetical protein
MRRLASAGALLAALLPACLRAQEPAGVAPKASLDQTAADEPVTVFTQHPRLFLRPARLRLLRRERERASVRWQRFDGFLAANAPMPESGLAQALYYQVSGNAAAGRRAIAWALGPGADLRQLALVFDWCQELLADTDRRALIARLQQGMAKIVGDESIPGMRSRTLAAVALFDHVAQVPNRELERVVHTWWEGKMAPALNQGREVVPREDAYALWELLHAIRDNTNLDLRESSRKFFKEFPIEHLMSYYPAVFPGEDNDFRIGATTQPGDPDLERAALSRAAELSMVAYDNNAEENQYLQGWLMHDSFILRGAFGAPYEFLWANPYQPGLGYSLVPLVYHSAAFGRLYVRSGWDDSADWFGCFDGTAQLFHEGRRILINLKTPAAPLTLDSAVIAWGPGAMNLHVMLDKEQEAVILAGLAPRRVYQVEIDDEEVFEETSDPGGLLVLDVPHDKQVGVRVRQAPASEPR